MTRRGITRRGLLARALPVAMLLALAGGWQRAGAGQNVWTAIGPDGGRAHHLCVDPADPRRAWAATDAGIFATGDGRHWRRLPLDDDVISLALDARGGAVLYAGGYHGGGSGYVRRSDDGGETWGPRVPVPVYRIDELAVDARMPDTVYASDGWDAIAVSRDGGATWRVANVDGYLRDTLAVDPHRAGRLYAAGAGGVHRSDDFGATWSHSPITSDTVDAVTVDPREPGVVYAGGYEGRVLRSRDAGETWEPIGSGLPDAAIRVLAGDPAGGAIFAGTARGLFRSSDGGATWVPTGLDAHEVDAVAVAGPAVYAAIGASGIARSADGGATFERASAGLGRVGGYVAAGADGALYVGASGVFRSGDRGRTWTLSARGLHDSAVTALAPHPTRAATLYAGTRAGVFVSGDAGQTWRPTGLVPAPRPFRFAGEIRALAIDPTAPDHLWASTWEGLYHSADGGETWTRAMHRYLRDEPVAHIALDPRRHGTIYVAGDGAGRCGLLRSRDGGASWQRLCRRATEFTALAVDPRQPDALYAGMRTHNWSRFGVYRSVDGGRHWTPLSDQPVDALAADPAHPNRLYSTGWRYLRRSDDSGATWYPFTAGLFRASVTGFAFVPAAPSLVVAGTWDGIYAIQPIEPCRGDCGGDGRTTVEDLVRAVAIGLGEADYDSCAAADVDASGGIDIAEIIAAVAAATSGCTGAVAAVAWDSPRIYALDAEPQRLFAADADRDGHVDALLVDAGGVQVWSGDGSGAFAPRPRQEIGGYIAGAHLSDLDGDAAPDLLVYVLAGDHLSPDAVHVLLNDGAGGFRTAGHYRFEPQHSFSFAAGDVDGDGVADLVLGGDMAAIAVHRGRGDGSFASPSLLDGGGCLSEYECPRLSAVADLDGNGAGDIVLEWTVLLGAGAGTFAAPISGGGGGLFAHLDDDAILDQVWYGGDEAIAIGAGAGDGTFAPPLHFGTGGHCRALAVADLNADGAADVVCGVAPGWDDGTPATADRLSVLRNLGDGAFTIPQRLAAPLQPDAVAAADVDGDGRLDLLAAGRCRTADASCRASAAGLLAVWRGAGTSPSPE